MAHRARRVGVRAVAGVVIGVTLAACQARGSGQAAPVPEQTIIDTMTFASVLQVDLTKFTRTKSGAYYRDMVVGTGGVAATDRMVTVQYVTSLPSGRVVETQSTPLSFTLGSDLIRGLREGLPGMKVGGFRTIVVPPALAYGSKTHGTVPPQSTIVFEIELLGVR